MIKEQLVKSTDQTYGGVSACTSITVHETANTSKGANAQAHANLQTSGNVRQASWHIQVDDTEAIRSYPDTAQCWHAGPTAADSIAVEICVNEDGDYDAAFRRAAAVVAGLRAAHGIPRSKVYEHEHWTGKNCPASLRAAGRWNEFLNLTDTTQESSMTKFSSPLPVGTYRTDGFDGLGRGRQHMGTDWAGPTVGAKTPVYAVADGIVEATGGPHKGAVLPGHSGLIVVIDHGILRDANGADRIRTNSNHLSRIDVKPGQRVKAGDQIGITGDTGNVTGVHLHFGVRQGSLRYENYFDPEAWLKGKGITVGTTPPLNSGANDAEDNKAIQAALKAMNLYGGVIDGVNGDMQKAAVKAFQKLHGLVQDGYWGPIVQAKYELLGRPGTEAAGDEAGIHIVPAAVVKPIKRPTGAVKPKLQHGWNKAQVKNIAEAMNRMGLNAGHPDGVYGPMLTAAVTAFQKQHNLVADGIYGPKTQAVYLLNRKIQQALKDQGYTKQGVDGWMGAQTEANVRDYQRRVGLKQDGIAGPATQKRLGL